ncbi:MAG TPA: 16S rRNA (uracil(1498)-N(3))-methyltransferase [Paraburkholderia sp.]|jgi:16S rRNA (uracil1498-N3)-methyltransferase|nr:16S rRNA (uracil(1498)-N(3))-methyltransferase [Paraburkholderia sp.]
MSTASVPRFFVGIALRTDAVVLLPDEVTRHVQVLRLAPGDPVALFNGDGGEFAAQIVSVEKRAATVRVGERRDIEAEPPYRLTLAQGIAGSDKMDWLIEKAVELGASRFVPLQTARGVVRLSGERAQRRHAHWQRIVQSACEQCGRNRLPEVAPSREFGAWLDALAAAPADGELRVLLSPRASMPFAALPDAAPRGDITLLIGPEGGLSPQEEDAARACGFTAVGLGPRVLRTETAGIAVLAALAGRWGGW